LALRPRLAAGLPFRRWLCYGTNASEQDQRYLVRHPELILPASVNNPEEKAGVLLQDPGLDKLWRIVRLCSF